jgi:hypothetical protein
LFGIAVLFVTNEEAKNLVIKFITSIAKYATTEDYKSFWSRYNLTFDIHSQIDKYRPVYEVCYKSVEA